MNADSYIDTESYDDVLEHELTQFIVREAVAVAMESPLRDPIVEGVERRETDDGDGADDGTTADEPSEQPEGGGHSLLTGLVVFVALFTVLYAVLRRLGGE